MRKKETDLRRKDIIIKEKDVEVFDAKVETSVKIEEIEKLTKDMEVKDEASEIAIAKANSLEDKLIKYGKTMHVLLADNAELKANKENESHVECKVALAAKEKMFKQALADKKNLAKRIEQIENTVADENNGLNDQQKSTSDKLKNKNKDLKDAQNALKKATDNERMLQETLNVKNRKIAELETTLENTKFLLAHTKDMNNKKSSEDNTAKAGKAEEHVNKFKSKNSSPTKAYKKCKFENTGSCSRLDGCRFIHPKETCQAYSKIGTCKDEIKCDFRHPRKVCGSWKTHRYCQEGENCRERHPNAFSSPPPNLVQRHERRTSSSQSFNQTPGYSQAPNCSQTPGFGQTQYRSCAPNQSCNQSFLEPGAAAACGPGQKTTNTAASLGCCQEQMYPQMVPSQHQPVRQDTHRHHQHHGPHQAWLGNPNQ